MSTLAQPARAGIPRRRVSLSDWLVAGYVVCLPVQIDIVGYHLAPSDLFLILTLCLAAFGLVTIKYVRSAWSIWHAGLVLVFCYSMLVAFAHMGYVTPYAIINKTLGLLVLFAGYAMIVGRVDNWQRARGMLRLFVGSTALLNTLAVAGFILVRTSGFNIPSLRLDEPRLSGLLIDPNAYGGLLAVALSVHLLTQDTREPLIGGLTGKLATLGLAIGMLLTYSRSAWIGMISLILIAIVLRPKTAIHLAVIIAIAGIVIVGALGTDYLGDMSQLSSRGTQESRIALITDAIPMFWQSPILGIGLGVFEQRIGVIIHNTPIWILTECGVVGFAIFTGFVLWIQLRGLNAYLLADRNRKPLVLGLIAASLAMLGLSLGIEALYQRHLWMVWALMASCHTLLKQRAKTAFAYRENEPCA